MLHLFLGTLLMSCPISGGKSLSQPLSQRTTFFVPLKRSPRPLIKYLFGDDPAKQIRDAKETNRIGNAVGSSKHNYRPIHRESSWPNKRHHAYKSGSAITGSIFLGKGSHATVR